LGFLRKNAPNSLVISPFPIRICCHSISCHGRSPISDTK
jgi:hypothetical protein